MKVEIKVTLNIDLADDLADPAPGDPLDYRMKNSAKDAVCRAIWAAEADGFTHDMEDITSITVLNVELEDQDGSSGS